MPKLGVKKWLQLFRAHTSPSTVLAVEVFFLLGGGSFLSWYNLVIVLWATLLHWFGFGHNSLMDYARGIDTKDPNKKHHPLVDGRIDVNSGYKVINWGLFITMILGLAIILLSPGNQIYVLGGMLVYIVCGHVYNDGLDHATVWSFFPLSLSYTALCWSMYFISSTAITETFLFALGYLFLVELFEILWEGNLKDIANPAEVNLLRSIGVKVDKGKLRIPIRAAALACGVRLLSLALLFATGYIDIKLSITGLTTLVLMMTVVIMMIFLVMPRAYDHTSDLRNSALEEIGAIFLLPVVLAPVIGDIEVFVLLVYAFLWFVIFNRFVWKTLIIPRV